jgi:hypothetical protein
MVLVACTESGGKAQEPSWLIYDRDDRLRAAAGLSAMEIGAIASSNGRALVNYDRERYTGHPIDLVDLRP